MCVVTAINFTDLRNSISSTMSRILYDEVYLTSGCPQALFNEQTHVDNSVGTWATNFAIGAWCFAAFVKLFFFPRPPIHPGFRKEPAEYVFPVYFLMQSISFFIAGAGHLVVESKVDQNKSLFEGFSYTFSALSAIAWLIIAFNLIGVTPWNRAATKTGRLVKTICWWVIVLAYSAFTIWASVTLRLTYVGLALIAVGIFLLILYIIKAFREKKYLWNLVKALALAIGIVSFGLYFVFQSECGSLEAYQNCFSDCPLPDGFNHNALFHVVFLISQVLLALGEDRLPSIQHTASPGQEKGTEKPLDQEQGEENGNKEPADE